jgi:hypothetical protein
MGRKDWEGRIFVKDIRLFYSMGNLCRDLAVGRY